MVEFLIENKSEINVIDVNGNTPLHNLSFNVSLENQKKMKIFEFFLKNEADFNFLNKISNSPFLCYCQNLSIDFQIFKFLFGLTNKKKIFSFAENFFLQQKNSPKFVDNNNKIKNKNKNNNSSLSDSFSLLLCNKNATLEIIDYFLQQYEIFGFFFTFFYIFTHFFFTHFFFHTFFFTHFFQMKIILCRKMIFCSTKNLKTIIPLYTKF